MVLRSHLTITEFLLLGLCADPKVLVLFWELFLGICLATMIGSLMAWWCPGRIPASSHLGTFSWVTSPPWIFASLQSQCPSFRKTSSKGKSLQKRDAWLKPSLCLTSEGQTSSCSLPWLMTPVLLSASLCSMARWWAASCVWIRCGLHGAWVFCTQLLTSPPCELELLWGPYHLSLQLRAAVLPPFVLLWYLHQRHCAGWLHMLHGFGTFFLISYKHTVSTILSISSTTGRNRPSPLLLPPLCSELLLWISCQPLFTSGAHLLHTILWSLP